MMRVPSLDIDLLRTFVAVADVANFTTAGATVGATQSAMSVRIRKLEDRLGRRLMERSPRAVRLTPFGEQFLDDARRVLETHDETALRALGLARKQTFALAVSDHAAGAGLPQVLAGLHARCPDVQFLITVGSSAALFDEFAQGKFDAVIIRRDDGVGAGRLLFRDRLIWAAAKTLVWERSGPLPLVSLAAPCGIRALAIAALAAKQIAWREAFVGTGVAAVQAAVSAGLGVACLGAKNVPADCKELTRSGLPALPSTEIVVHSRTPTPESSLVMSAIAAAFKKAGMPTHPSRSPAHALRRRKG